MFPSLGHAGLFLKKLAGPLTVAVQGVGFRGACVGTCTDTCPHPCYVNVP